MNIPRVEIDTFLLTVQEAVDLAHEGKPEEGYTAILAGAERAREAQADGEPWADDLLGLWTQAADGFAEQHQIGRA